MVLKLHLRPATPARSSQEKMSKLIFTYHGKLFSQQRRFTSSSKDPSLVSGKLYNQRIVLSIVSDYRYYCLVNARLERQQREKPLAQRLTKNLKMSMLIFDRTGLTNALPFLSRFVEEFGLEKISELQVCVIISSFLKGKAHYHFFATRKDSSYTGLCY